MLRLGLSQECRLNTKPYNLHMLMQVENVMTILIDGEWSFSNIKNPLVVLKKNPIKKFLNLMNLYNRNW